MKLRLIPIAFGMSLSVAVLLTSNPAYAAATKGGYPICFQKEWLDDLMRFLAADDRGSYEAYFNSRKCLMARPGVKVTIVEPPGILGTTTGVVADGVKGWTLREAIDYKK